MLLIKKMEPDLALTVAVSTRQPCSQDANPLSVPASHKQVRRCHLHAGNWCSTPGDGAGGGIHTVEAGHGCADYQRAHLVGEAGHLSAQRGGTHVVTAQGYFFDSCGHFFDK